MALGVRGLDAQVGLGWESWRSRLALRMEPPIRGRLARLGHTCANLNALVHSLVQGSGFRV